jgi:hypothetical protein
MAVRVPRIPVRIPILSKLTRVQRILIVVVAVVVTAFFFAVGCTNDGQGNAAEPPGFIKGIGDLFGPPTVERKDITAPCLNPAGKLTIDGSCKVHVDAGSDDVRELKLKAEGAVTVRAPVPRQDSIGEKQVNAAEGISIAIDADAADIEIICADSPCVVSLVS